MSTDLVSYQGPIDRLIVYSDERAAIEATRKQREADVRRQAKSEMSALRARFENDIAELCGGADSERMQMFAAALYWSLDIPMTWIGEAIGKPHAYVRAAAEAYPVPAGKVCVVCGFQDTASSREARDFMNDPTSYRWTQGNWGHGICDSCWPKCIYCKQPVGVGRTTEWYTEAIQKEAEVYHVECAPKEPARQTRREQYAEYLQSDHWRSVREWALERSGRRCQVCNTDERQLHVHHRTYERVGKELPEDLIVLCDGCHEIFHREGRLA